MTISERATDRVVVLELDGQPPANRDGEPLVDVVHHWLRKGYRYQAFDLAGVSDMDDSGLSEIAGAYQLLSSQGGALALLHVSNRVQRLLDGTRLETVQVLRSERSLTDWGPLATARKVLKLLDQYRQ